MKRVVQPEILDSLPPGDPHARQSRRDLRRLNAWMRHPVILARALERHRPATAAMKLTEIGAGDGEFLLAVARRLRPGWPGTKVTLLDRQDTVAPGTLAAFEKAGWQAHVVVQDVFDRTDAGSGRSDVIVANLFLHHFEDSRLRELFGWISQQTGVFIALEPRRNPWSMLAARGIWAIGCNAVTRHDAVVSVRAGFVGQELSCLWPESNQWQLSESRAGLFGHQFIARRIR